MPGRDFLDEATRQLGICNACRYCEGYCAVFPALELRTELTEGDVTYLAHLCHDCRNCYDACMFAPPHEFAVNIPALLAEARVRTYARYSWPRLLSSWVRHSGWATGVVTGGGLLAVGALVLGLVGWARVTSPHAGPGAFYAVVPYLAMVIPALILSFYGAGVVTGGALAYWTEIHGSLRDLLDLRALGRAAGEALGQRWFKGGGAGEAGPGGGSTRSWSGGSSWPSSRPLSRPSTRTSWASSPRIPWRACRSSPAWREESSSPSERRASCGSSSQAPGT